MLTRRCTLILAGAALAVPALADAAQPEVFAEGGAAINGYDPVAYFELKGPVKGTSEFSLSWNGATWHFASAANRDLFEADPEAHAPQYGGYCAYAVSRGYTASTDPDAWSVHDGKLYLNYNRLVRALWSRDIPGNIANGDANWPGVLK